MLLSLVFLMDTLLTSTRLSSSNLLQHSNRDYGDTLMTEQNVCAAFRPSLINLTSQANLTITWQLFLVTPTKV